MKFIIDNSLSPQLRDWLQELGHDVVHVRDYGLAKADDGELFDLAAVEDRIIVTADNDFGKILAARNASWPSVVIFRRELTFVPRDQFEFLIANLDQIENDLTTGASVVFDAGRLRIRPLPFWDETI